jgi:hypothetical protein
LPTAKNSAYIVASSSNSPKIIYENIFSILKVARKLIILNLIHMFLEKDATLTLKQREYHVLPESSRKVLWEFIG